MRGTTSPSSSCPTLHMCCARATPNPFIMAKSMRELTVHIANIKIYLFLVSPALLKAEELCNAFQSFLAGCQSLCPHPHEQPFAMASNEQHPAGGLTCQFISLDSDELSQACPIMFLQDFIRLLLSNIQFHIFTVELSH